jgi:hypothetical protein
MRKFFILLVITTTVSCFDSKTFKAPVNFEKIEVEKKGNERQTDTLLSDSIYKVSATYYTPVDAPEYLKDSILKYTKFLFAAWFDIKGKFDLNLAIQKHFDEYSEQIEENDLPEHASFVLNILPEEVYQNEHIVAFAYKWMIYEGGAHPNYGKFCFVIDKSTGNKIEYTGLIAGNEAKFLQIAEAEFKAQSGIKKDEEIYSVYHFENDKFHLTDNYTFTRTGIVFCYNPYDIAPYSFGMIELTLPYEKVKNLIKWP